MAMPLSSEPSWLKQRVLMMVIVILILVVGGDDDDTSGGLGPVHGLITTSCLRSPPTVQHNNPNISLTRKSIFLGGVLEF